jgi:O-antigen/teichoic acid export membrane protein
MSTTPAGAPSSRSLFKNVLQSSGLYSIPNLAQPLISVLVLRVVTGNLRRADFGIAEILARAGELLGLLLGGCFGASIGYFYFERDTAEERRPVVGTSVLGSAFFGAAIMLACWLLGGPITRAAFGNETNVFYLHVMALGAVPALALETLLGWTRVAGRPRTTVAGALARALLGAATVLFLAAFFRLNIVGYIASGVVANAIPAVALAAVCWRATRPTFDGRLFVRMVKFSAPVGIGSLAVYCINFGDRLILPRYASLADIGLYVLAYKIGMLCILPYNSFNSYWSAQMYGVMKRDDADSLFARLLTYAVGAIVVPCLGLTVLAKPAIRLLAHHDYSGAAAFVPIIAFAYGIRCLGDFFRSRFYVAGRPGCDAICNWLGAALCIGGYFYWIPRRGTWGAAIATLAAFAAILAIALAWTYRIRPYRVEGRRLAKMAIALAVVLAAFAAAPAATLTGQIAFGALLVAGFPGLLWVLGFATAAERQVLRAAVGKVAARIAPAR